MKIEDGEIKNDTTDDQCSTSNWKQMQDTESSVEEKPKLEIDLRVERVLQDAILKDEEQMEEVSEKLEKSIRDELKKGEMILTWSCSN